MIQVREHIQQGIISANFIEGDAAIAQNVRTNLDWILGENPLNINQGLNIQTFFDRSTPDFQRQTMIREIVIGVEGVIKILSFEMERVENYTLKIDMFLRTIYSSQTRVTYG